MADRFPVRHIDHLEFHVGNARQAAAFYQRAFGFRVSAYRGLETGCREITSYVLECGTVRFVLTSGLAPGNAAARFAHAHGDGVAVDALEVRDAAHAFAEAQRHGAIGAAEPTEEGNSQGRFRSAAIRAYGDTVIRFVERQDYAGVFAPGFEPRRGPEPPGADVRLTAIDHVVANVERGQMDRWVQFLAEARALRAPACRRRGDLHRLLGADVEGHAGRRRAHQVPDQPAGDGGVAALRRRRRGTGAAAGQRGSPHLGRAPGRADDLLVPLRARRRALRARRRGRTREPVRIAALPPRTTNSSSPPASSGASSPTTAATSACSSWSPPAGTSSRRSATATATASSSRARPTASATSGLRTCWRRTTSGVRSRCASRRVAG